MKISVSDVATATNGQINGPEALINGAAIDIQHLKPGQLFVPIKEASNGHDFIPAAISRGATAYLTDGPKVKGATAIVVKNTAKALADIAKLCRQRMPDRVVAITGSVGKTSAKDLLGPIIQRTGPTAISPRSFNNEIGVPLTMLNARDDCKSAILEMGAYGLGDIARLSAIARPTVGIILNIGLAHVGPFGGISNIAKVHSELVEALPSRGVAVLNVNDENVLKMKTQTQARVLTYGVNSGDVRATDVQMNRQLQPSFRLWTPNGSVLVNLKIHGQHQISNAVAAAAGAVALGVGINDILEGLEEGVLSQWRLELLSTRTGAALLNDVYNANPVSMTAALNALARLEVAGRKVAVLGEMAELGDIAQDQHAKVGELADLLGIEIYSVNAPDYGATNFDSIEEAYSSIRPVAKDDAILVKGSRAAQMEDFIDLLCN